MARVFAAHAPSKYLDCVLLIDFNVTNRAIEHAPRCNTRLNYETKERRACLPALKTRGAFKATQVNPNNRSIGRVRFPM